jgi:hypothetical protein
LNARFVAISSVVSGRQTIHWNAASNTIASDILSCKNTAVLVLHIFCNHFATVNHSSIKLVILFDSEILFQNAIDASAGAIDGSASK